MIGNTDMNNDGFCCQDNGYFTETLPGAVRESEPDMVPKAEPFFVPWKCSVFSGRMVISYAAG